MDERDAELADKRPSVQRRPPTCWCGSEIEQPTTGRPRRYCSDRCRVDAHRQRAWDAYEELSDAYQRAELAAQVQFDAEFRAWQNSPDRPGPAWAEEAIAQGWNPPRGYPGKVAPAPTRRGSGITRPPEPAVPRPAMQAKPVTRGQWW